MRLLTIISILSLLINNSVHSNQTSTLTVYTYDSFVSEWGPGPIIEEKFEKTLILN